MNISSHQAEASKSLLFAIISAPSVGGSAPATETPPVLQELRVATASGLEFWATSRVSEFILGT